MTGPGLLSFAFRSMFKTPVFVRLTPCFNISVTRRTIPPGDSCKNRDAAASPLRDATQKQCEYNTWNIFNSLGSRVNRLITLQWSCASARRASLPIMSRNTASSILAPRRSKIDAITGLPWHVESAQSRVVAPCESRLSMST
ncbi:hypothetical protein CABS01_17261 [Colletotrichum abscissum]|uniref:uncharacterized protein n=1 Tax=Colletotrichum abscissum TaxID=1671311 RepID=UPI0027D4DB88|nr:uncharacterized protein CABS01_17261 [Colletotrichum abscissum]KAK1480673.1 hypothetical protein CABS01_17261 [Colletotrichum abscissum]